MGFVTKALSSDSYPNWHTKEIINEVKIKNKCKHKYKGSGNKYYLHTYRKVRFDVKKKINKQYKSYVKTVENYIIKIPNPVWTYVNNCKKISRIPAEVLYNGLELNSPIDIVNAFADLFLSVYKLSSTHLAVSDNKHSEYNGDGFQVDADIVEKKLKLIKNKSTSGIDKIPAFS